jgi:hypothetical protein
MNEISVSTEREWFGLYFDLVVDGKPIQEILNCEDAGIPYWLVTDGIPHYPADSPNETHDVRLVAVCGCSVPGCGHTRCTMKRNGDTVIFKDFVGERGHQRQNARFVFRSVDYDAAEEFMAHMAEQERNRQKGAAAKL